MNKALFLDRDGVINKEVNYLYRIQDFKPVPGVIDFCKWACRNGYIIIVVTNQSGIARKLYTLDEFLLLTDHIRGFMKRNGVSIASTYFCPHHPEGVDSEYRIVCKCRKPEPGLIYCAAKMHNIDCSESILIGDKVSDIAAGRAAKIGTTILIGTGHTVSVENRKLADFYFDNFDAILHRMKQKALFFDS